MKKHIIKHDVPVPVAASADPLAGLILVQPDYVHYSPDGGAGTWTETPQPDSTLIRKCYDLSTPEVRVTSENGVFHTQTWEAGRCFPRQLSYALNVYKLP